MNVTATNALIPESFEYTDAFTGVTETINLQLRRMSFGISASTVFRKAIDDSDTNSIAEILSGLIGDWNLDADGEPFAPTAENIALLPVEFVAVMSEKVFARLFPNPQKAGTSLNGSEPAEQSTGASATNSESGTTLAEPVASGA